MRTALRFAVLFVSLTYGVCEAAPRLVNHVVTKDAYVRVGDIWRDAGSKADEVVGYAPKLGQQVVLDSRWLYKVAEAYEVDWVPASIEDSILVERQSYEVTRAEVTEHILASLIDKGADPDLKVSISNRHLHLYVADPMAATVAVDDVRYNPRSGRFTALIRVPADNPMAKTVRITGKVGQLVDVPVPARHLRKGETISEQDIRWIEMPAERLRANLILDLEQLIGKSPKRLLRDGVPVRVSEVRNPILVERHSLVTLVLRSKLMSLSARAKAMTDGGLGDIIRVMNVESRKILDARVSGPGTVVLAASPEQMVMKQ